MDCTLNNNLILLYYYNSLYMDLRYLIFFYNLLKLPYQTKLNITWIWTVSNNQLKTLLLSHMKWVEDGFIFTSDAFGWEATVPSSNELSLDCGAREHKQNTDEYECKKWPSRSSFPSQEWRSKPSSPLPKKPTTGIPGNSWRKIPVSTFFAL